MYRGNLYIYHTHTQGKMQTQKRPQNTLNSYQADPQSRHTQQLKGRKERKGKGREENKRKNKRRE